MLEELTPLLPVHFFSLQLPCYLVQKKHLEKKHLLPSTADLTRKKQIASLYLGWHKEGLSLKIESKHPLKSLELFIDTRDQKQVGYPTRFCHHFFFDIENEEGSEITRIKVDESHELCNPALLQISSGKIFIPKEALFGYDPTQFARLGFTYRINRGEQLFSISDENFSIEKHPSFWASLTLE